MRFLKASHYILTRIIIIIMILLLLLSSYFIWSNQRTYLDAEEVYEDLIKLKPDIVEDKSLDWSKLKAINKDVCGWLTVDGTKIDYPVVQGDDNLFYMNRDFYGNSSLAGSIFLDTRNSKDFSDAYSLIYGHHMDNSLMFGDLDQFKEETFFIEHSTGKLLTEQNVKDLTILAVMEISDSTQEIFNPTMWGSDLSDLAAFIKTNSIYVRDSAMTQLTQKPKMIQVISLVTCASGHTGTRTVLLLTAERDKPNPERIPNTDTVTPKTESSPPAQTGDSLFNSPVFWLIIMGFGLILLTVIFIIEQKTKKSDSDKK